MKKTIALAALLLGPAAVSSLYAQGQILWGNQFSGALQARIYGPETADRTRQLRGNGPAPAQPAGTTIYTGPLLSGTSFTVGLFLGDSATDAASQMAARATTTFRTGNTAGFFFPLEYTDQTRPPGRTGVNVQFRAWDNQGGAVTSWAQVMAQAGPQGPIAAGSGDPFTVGALGGVLGPDQFPVPSTLGARSFNLTVVPEPSLIALGALGLGALLLRRRK